ncbi:hypothetical protein [Archaeoglobus neptunius]|uniref:hypothetical protein n=1 Tax=Archaeoglobus neptunius TaxID=2798580 RepID=UPI001926B27E|nr:hypothetical protein [Archaeoglobus neptunius]
MDFLRVEFDIQHHLVLSKKNRRDHALIRMIVSTLSTPGELANLSKRDFRFKKTKSFDYYTVRLSEGGRSRISPVDRKTYEIIQSLPAKPFDLTWKEMDEIVAKYSPLDVRYTCVKLREAVKSILSDSAFFGEIEDIKDIDRKYAFMIDFNPLYTGFWDLEEEDGIEDFVLSYAEINKIKDSKKIASETGIDEVIVREILESGKRSILAFKN